MKHNFSALSVLALSMMGALAPNMKADEWDKKTYITIDRSIEVERAVLPAGSYVLKLVDLPSDRHLVRIMNAEETRVIATVSTVPIFRLVPANDSEFQFRSFEAGRPPALRAWFYPGDPVGFEFKVNNQPPVESAKRQSTTGPNVSSH
jgi:hypothetical protein